MYRSITALSSPTAHRPAARGPARGHRPDQLGDGHSGALGGRPRLPAPRRRGRPRRRSAASSTASPASSTMSSASSPRWPPRCRGQREQGRTTARPDRAGPQPQRKATSPARNSAAPPPIARACAAGWGWAACPMVSPPRRPGPPPRAVSGCAIKERGQGERGRRVRGALVMAPAACSSSAPPKSTHHSVADTPGRARRQRRSAGPRMPGGADADSGDRLAQGHDDQRTMPLGEVRRGDLEPAAEAHTSGDSTWMASAAVHSR